MSVKESFDKRMRFSELFRLVGQGIATQFEIEEFKNLGGSVPTSYAQLVDSPLKDSGERRTFESGAQRDRGGDKMRPDLISPFFMERLAIVLAKGAAKYSARNWEKGMPQSEILPSLYRHLLQYQMGDESEDHLGALAFNVMALIHNDSLIRQGKMPSELDDLPKYLPIEIGENNGTI